LNMQNPPRRRAERARLQQQTKRKKKLILLIIPAIAVVVIAAIAAAWLLTRSQSTYDPYQFDTDAMAGRIARMTEEEIQAELDRVVEEGMFNISIASTIVFEGPGKPGHARIENIEANRYHMQVDLFLDETGEKIYSSKLIQPGYSIEYIDLTKRLEPGQYAATAIFSAITQEEMQLFGTVGAQVQLYVLSGQSAQATPLPTSTPTPAP